MICGKRQLINYLFIFLFLFLARRGLAIILLVFHSRPIRTIGPPSVGGSPQRPFSLPFPGFEPRQAQCKQQMPAP